jgi:hypothetical protein
MKIKDIFEEELIGSDKVMVSLDNTLLNGIVRANETASYIISCLKNETTEEQITSCVCTRYRINEDLAQKGVTKILSQLRELNLIEE